MWIKLVNRYKSSNFLFITTTLDNFVMFLNNVK